MKFFTKLFLAVALFAPVIAEAEQVPAITYNPSRSGWYTNLKVVSTLSFSPQLVIQDLSIGARGAANKKNVLTLRTLEGTNVGVIRTNTIKSTGDTASIEFSNATLSRGSCSSNCGPLKVNIQGGTLKGKDGFVELWDAAEALPVYGEKVSWDPETVESFQVKGADANVQVVENATADSTSKTSMSGWKLGPYEIPHVDTSGKCYRWKNATIGGTLKKVLVLTSQCS